MRLVVGLGNPGQKYEGSRHNVGFRVADELHRAEGLPEWRDKFAGAFAQASGLAVLKPMTMMNLSGRSVQPAAAFLKAAPGDVVVVHDELDLPFGEVRVKVGGGHAGHNGLRSILECLGSPDFVRVRVGVGRPPPGFSGDVADYVLSAFDGPERAALPAVLVRAEDAVRRVLRDGADAAMNAVNQRPRL